MKTKLIKTRFRLIDVHLISAALLLAVGTVCPVSAQWTLDDTYAAWTGFNNNFFYTSGTSAWYTTTQHDSTTEGIWEAAEEIEVAVDAYYWSVNNYPTHDHSGYVAKINALCTGLKYNYWSGGAKRDFGINFAHDAFNDDLMWITIAFTRAYQATGNSTWLTDAKNIFDVVWGRARINGDALHNGLGQYQTDSSGTIIYSGTIPKNPDSPVNYTCVIAGHLLYNNGCGSGYLTDAQNVYKWAANPQGNLYVASSGKVPDSYPTGTTDYSYNYGIAIHAAVLEADLATCQNMANYLMNNFVGATYKYNGTWNGYNVLPNYSPSGNDAGYDGICLRGVGFAQSRGYLTSTQITWAQQNVAAAFAHRNTTTNLMHGDWQSATPATGLSSWDCSAALAGMLNISSDQTLQAAGTDGKPLGDLNWFPEHKGVAQVSSNVPSNFSLSQNYPNPFNPTTVIDYTAPKASYVSLKVYNILGQKVATLYQGFQKAGTYKTDFDASRLSSGVYLYRLMSNGFTMTKKMILMK
ncbi:MAG: T9SS type A sorting domain-containing protein [Ignavibacteriaceae bacterium]